MVQRAVHVVVVTGLSGSGKSTAIKAFEDLHYFCIDNLPVPLLPEFLALCERDMPDISRIALGIDIRERKFLNDYDRFFGALEEAGYRFEILFLETATEVLQRRFSQTRRLHPMASPEGLLLDAIRDEREKLKALRSRASRIVDTGALTIHQLKAMITRTYSLVSESELLSIQTLSFGFKHGLPLEADLVMDVRFLPNPYFVEPLKHQDGCSQEVEAWVLQSQEAQEFLEEYTRLVLRLIPCYIQEGKRYLTIAFGCTGGKHRSVVMANQMGRRLRENDYLVSVFHRDIHLE